MTTIDTSTWTDEQKAAHAALQSELDAEIAATAALAAAEVARQHDPVVLLVEQKLALERTRRARAAAQASAEGEAAYRDACLKYGEHRCAIIRNDVCPVVIRQMGDDERRAVDARQKSLRTPGPPTDDLNPAQIKAGEDALRLTVLYPPPERFNDLVKTYSLLWSELFLARDLLMSGHAESLQKKD